jgi:hypothetical protein
MAVRVTREEKRRLRGVNNEGKRIIREKKIKASARSMIPTL